MNKDKIHIQSPSGNISVKINIVDSKIFYSLYCDGKLLIESSEIALRNTSLEFKGTIETSTIKDNHHPLWWKNSLVVEEYNQLKIPFIDSTKIKLNLICRVFDNCMALRFVFPKQKELAGKKIHLVCDFNLSGKLYFPNGEDAPLGPLKIKDIAERKSTTCNIPMLVESGRKWLCLMEADLFSSAELAETETMQIKSDSGKLYTDTPAHIRFDHYVTPWRTVMLAGHVWDFANYNTLWLLGAECKINDLSWISSGKASWDWRVRGMTFDGFQYECNLESAKRFVDFIALAGGDYFVLDDKWYLVEENQIKPLFAVEELIEYANAKDIGVILYYDERYAQNNNKTVLDMHDVMRYFASLGAAGIKYGFKGNDANFTCNAVRCAAENKLLINFHDNPCPMSGVERTMPNAISREYCHSQLDCRTAFLPASFVNFSLINAISGPIDQGNGYFGLDKHHERSYGPKNEYLSTIISEAARFIITSLGLSILPDAPEQYLKYPKLFDLIKEIPAQWDETRILDAAINEYITVLKRSKNTIYIASVNSENKERKLKLSLDFLDEGEYSLIYYEDAPETNIRANPCAFNIRKTTVSSNDIINFKMATGGGTIIVLSKNIYNKEKEK